LHNTDHTFIIAALGEQETVIRSIQEGAKATNCLRTDQSWWKGSCCYCTSQVCLTLIQAIRKETQDAATRKGGSQGMQGMSTEEKDRQSKMWKIAEAEYNE